MYMHVHTCIHTYVCICINVYTYTRYISSRASVCMHDPLRTGLVHLQTVRKSTRCVAHSSSHPHLWELDRRSIQGADANMHQELVCCSCSPLGMLFHFTILSTQGFVKSNMFVIGLGGLQVKELQLRYHDEGPPSRYIYMYIIYIYIFVDMAA